MKTKTNTKIVLEKRHYTLLRLRRPKRTHAWCGQCRAEKEMLSPHAAAAISGTTQMAVYRRLEMGELHYTEAKAGVLLICRASFENEHRETKGA